MCEVHYDNLICNGHDPEYCIIMHIAVNCLLEWQCEDLRRTHSVRWA
jgi:hypothetical protein